MRRGSAASRLTPAMLPRGLIARARLLHVSGISLAISTSACDTALAAMELARAAGALLSFDTNLRLKLWPLDQARRVMNQAMRLCDICLPSYDDITALSGLTAPQAIVDHCLALGARIVALKLGTQGAIVADAGATPTTAVAPTARATASAPSRRDSCVRIRMVVLLAQGCQVLVRHTAQ